jgi:ACR3 family arsenite efflux pump ArsB
LLRKSENDFLPVGTAANPAALATAVGVLTEVPVLLLIKFTNKTRGKFPL